MLEGGVLSYYEKADDEHVPIGESKGALDMTQYKINEKKTKGDKIMLSPLTPGGDLGAPCSSSCSLSCSCSCVCLSCPQHAPSPPPHTHTHVHTHTHTHTNTPSCLPSYSYSGLLC